MPDRNPTTGQFFRRHFALVSILLISPCSALIRDRICRPFKGAQESIPTWWAGTTTLFVVPAPTGYVGCEIDSSESIPGLHKRLQIRALDFYLLLQETWPNPDRVCSMVGMAITGI